ncbi:alpha/beta hydrolase fold domain-containing protein [Clostridium sp. B9]|uniref:alpha/beta hydrolase fold domain-containing protein n=1 Tax=Clostridium sp. B9 TaxID=3423224 RepID=UPI003D2EE465
MKKFLKVLGVIFLSLIIVLGVVAYSFRAQIGFYINIGKEYLALKENPPTIEELQNMSMSKDMDYKDIVYKDTHGKTQTLDIYGPEKKLKNGSPVILYVHGGSWVYGNKEIPEVIAPLLDAFRKEGYTVISVGYELARDKVDFYKQTADVKDAIRWVYKNKDTYGFNTDEIGVIGASAGAHLSLLATYSGNDDFVDDKELAKYPSEVKYVVDFFGPTELDTLDMSSASWDLNRSIERTESQLNGEESISGYMDKYSPINYVKPNLPKTLIVHGRQDKLVPYSNSLDLYNKSKEEGNEVQILTLENSGHDFSQIDVNEVFELGLKVLNFILFNTRF